MSKIQPYIYNQDCRIDFEPDKAYSCGIRGDSLCPNTFKIPVVDEKYFEKTSLSEKCLCIEKLKSSLEILAKSEPAKYNAYLNEYKNKYNQNKCADVFKNYIPLNQEEIYSSVTQADKERIESQSKKERNQRVFIGVAVLVVAIGMISIYATKND
jgi:hypothetical protein